MKHIKWVFLIFGIIALSFILSQTQIDPRGLREGDCVLVTIGNTSFPARIFNIRGDNRYSIHYVNNRGDISKATVKPFEIEKCEEDNIPNDEEEVTEEIEEKVEDELEP